MLLRVGGMLLTSAHTGTQTVVAISEVVKTGGAFAPSACNMTRPVAPLV